MLNGKLPPISEELLIYFVGHCFRNLKLQYTTIKLYLCGIRYFCLKDNTPSPFTSQQNDNSCLARLSLFMQSVKRLQTISVKTRLPITSDILGKICHKLRKGFFSRFIDCMLETACIIAFYGFLRCGEFTVTNVDNFDPECNLCISDIRILPDLAIIHLKQSKTDPFRKGIDIQLHKLNTLLCPYKALVNYLQIRTAKQPCNPSDPLFITDSLTALDRNFFISKLKLLIKSCGLNPDSYNGHSFRIGAATSAGKANIADHLIKTLGRWKSDSYCRYIRTDKSSIKHAQQKISSS